MQTYAPCVLRPPRPVPPVQGGLLDCEAASRCTTVYLVDRRLDMLPALLSEDLCSLRSGQGGTGVGLGWDWGGWDWGGTGVALGWQLGAYPGAGGRTAGGG